MIAANVKARVLPAIDDLDQAAQRSGLALSQHNLRQKRASSIELDRAERARGLRD